MMQSDRFSYKEEIAKIIEVDSLGYLSLDHVVSLTKMEPDRFCIACFGGGYPTSVPEAGQKNRFEQKIQRV